MPEPDARLAFSFDGRRVSARASQTIAGALHDDGIHVLSRSFKYHRPRGLFCATGRCPNCLCTVDGEPNVRTCTTAVRGGMRVESQNVWPSLRFDALAVFDRLHRLMPVGFYYRVMHRPRWMWPVFEHVIRRVAGLGRVDTAGGGDAGYDRQHLFADVAVIGAGWAGLHAAIAAADAGADVVLVDDQDAPGGHLRFDPDLAATVELESLVAGVSDHPRVRLISSATAFGCYEGPLVAIEAGRRLIELRAPRIVIATGGWEQPVVFENNDRPGILLAGGVQRLLTRDGCRFPGEVVVLTDNAGGYRVARQLAAAGSRIAAVVDLRDDPPDDAGAFPRWTGHTVVGTRGRRHVTAALVAPHPPAAGNGSARVIRCRWIVQAVGFTTATSLAAQAGSRVEYDPARQLFRVADPAERVVTAGAVNGTFELDDVAAEGRLAGQDAAGQDAAGLDAAGSASPIDSEAVSGIPPPVSGKAFVCLCEDVTDRDLADAVSDGFSNIETLKRYATVCMGPCQGKMCHAASIAVCARENGLTINQTGRTTARPPEQAVRLGVLAGRSPHRQLVRRSALHHWHQAAGVRFMDAGAWKRPESYSDPDAEWRAVRNGVGMIDVSTLGKLRLDGEDVVEFLEFVYPNRFAGLKVGRVRYGVICDESGIIVDDGTIARLDIQRYFLTTTTGNADGVDSWFRWWLADRSDWDVQLTNVTSGFAAMNLAGPASRDVLARVCDADLSSEARPYLSASEFTVAGVPSIVLRIGFVGELGYEIHVPTQYGRHVWEAIFEAGRAEGIRPFGVEAQRRLRLDKKHILAGHDTDALSNPFEADLSWIVKLDKPDFVGRKALARCRQRGPQNRLVGFRLEGDTVPDEASLVIEDGRLAGRVTSARVSPAAGAVVGLAWIPAGRARDGETFEILVNGKTVSAVVQDAPFYDPDGERLKS